MFRGGRSGTAVQSGMLDTDAAGVASWTYPVPYPVGTVPRITAVAIGPNSSMYNVQIVGTPTNTGCSFQVNRTQFQLVALLGLTIGVQASPGITTILAHATAGDSS